MKSLSRVSALLGFFLFTPLYYLSAQSVLNCQLCHNSENDLWLASRHANTLNDVADELASEWIGLSPDSVILGQDAENCVACHSPVAVTVNGGLSEAQVMSHFFSTTNGVYTDSTHALDTATWPHIACVSCHNVPDDHPTTMPALALFNSTSLQYDSVPNSNVLCGQCHGSLKFADTDHRLMDAWQLSKHGHGGQADVASELASEWSGSTPDEVIHGADGENCIACHAPNSVVMNGGMTEAEALAHFFTTSNGTFTDSTGPADTTHWPEVACITCHNPHKPGDISYFNSTTKTYQAMGSTNELCGQCHGSLRFPDTDHLSYNIESGTGGIGVPDTLTMPGIQCVDCHMHAGTEDGTNAAMYSGHSWSVFVEEPDGTTEASCTSCHLSINAKLAGLIVQNWKSEFAELDSMANARIAEVESMLEGSSDSLRIRLWHEAQQNLIYAESDESGGVHNHNYVMSLVKDALEKSNLIITGTGEQNRINGAKQFVLYQNYPNPFNPGTTINYEIPKKAKVEIFLFNAVGQKVKTLFSGIKKPGFYKINLNGSDLPSGVYFYQLKTAGYQEMRKCLLLR